MTRFCIFCSLLFTFNLDLVECFQSLHDNTVGFSKFVKFVGGGIVDKKPIFIFHFLYNILLAHILQTVDIISNFGRIDNIIRCIIKYHVADLEEGSVL